MAPNPERIPRMTVPKTMRRDRMLFERSLDFIPTGSGMYDSARR